MSKSKSSRRLEPASPSARRGAPRRAVGRPADTDGEETRRRIMAAAQKEFADKGYRETSNKMIADRAGVTAGSIYHYFDSKRDLFLAIHDQIQEQVMGRLNTAFAAADSFRDAILRLLDEFQKLRVDMPSANGFTAVVRTEALRNPEIAQARVDAQWRGLFRRLTDLGVKTGEIDPARAHLVRTVISAINLGVVQHGSEAPDQVHADCMVALGELVNGSLLHPKKKDAAKSARSRSG